MSFAFVIDLDILPKILLYECFQPVSQWQTPDMGKQQARVYNRGVNDTAVRDSQISASRSRANTFDEVFP